MKYYIVCSNDGSEASKRCSTLKEAKKEMRDIIKEDKQLGLDAGDIDYYIIEREETDTSISEREIR